jgi:hypothetical protein
MQTFSILAILSLLPLLFAGSSARGLACGHGAASAADHVVVDHYRFDAELKLSWAAMVDCRHPEWPARLVIVDAVPDEHGGRRNPGGSMPADRAVTAPIRIASGSRVDVWRGGEQQIRLSGVAVESAMVGQPIHVRAGLGNTPLRGIVRGPHSVELTEENKAGWREP